LYDWANSAFVLIVVSGFFPVFFNSYYSSGVDSVETTVWLGMGNTIAGIIIAVLSLFMGAVAVGKKKFLGGFAVIGAIATAALFLVAQGEWVTALILFVIGNIGFSCANLFYDALLVDVADEKNMDFVSSLGFALGYIGSVGLFGGCVWATVNPGILGMADSAAVVKLSFLAVAIWWIVFSIPLFMFVKEKKQLPSSSTNENIISTIIKTFTDIIKKPPLLLFLCAYWFYFDGVNTFIRMAVDFGLSIGFGSNALMIALIIVQIVAFPSSILFGYLSTKVGAGRMIAAGVVIYILISSFGSIFMRTETHFIILAALTGLAQGGIQALSRSYFGKLIPADKSTEYFSFYNVVSRFAVVGPAVVGLVAMLARNMGAQSALASRIGMSSVNVFFIAGLIFLLFAEKARRSWADTK
jgi:UMF1 family MFS transporter